MAYSNNTNVDRENSKIVSIKKSYIISELHNRNIFFDSEGRDIEFLSYSKLRFELAKKIAVE